MKSGVEGDDIIIILKPEFTWTGFDDGVFSDDSHIVSTWYPCGHIRCSVISKVE